MVKVYDKVEGRYIAGYDPFTKNNQSKRNSLIETIVGTFIGLITSMLAQTIIYPMYGFKVTLVQNISITLIFTVISVVRGYLVRRLFNKIK